MKLKTVKLSDPTQDVFISAEEVDRQTIRLDISEAYNDSAIELTVNRAILVSWCESLISAFDNDEPPSKDTSADT